VAVFRDGWIPARHVVQFAKNHCDNARRRTCWARVGAPWNGTQSPLRWQFLLDHPSSGRNRSPLPHRAARIDQRRFAICIATLAPRALSYSRSLPPDFVEHLANARSGGRFGVARRSKTGVSAHRNGA
jgi:hypothetical protein